MVEDDPRPRTSSDGALAGGCAGAWRIERSDVAAGRAQKAVCRIVRVHIPSCDGPLRVDGYAGGPLAGSGTGAGDVERHDDGMMTSVVSCDSVRR